MAGWTRPGFGLDVSMNELYQEPPGSRSPINRDDEGARCDPSLARVEGSGTACHPLLPKVSAQGFANGLLQMS